LEGPPSSLPPSLTESNGGGCRDRSYLSQSPGHRHSPTPIWAADEPAGPVPSNGPCSLSTGPPAVLTTAGPFVVLFLRDNLLTEEDHRPPGLPTPEHRAHYCREGEVLPHCEHQVTALFRPSWAFFQRMLRRVHRCVAVVASRRAFPPDSTQVFAKTSMACHHLCQSVRDPAPSPLDPFCQTGLDSRDDSRADRLFGQPLGSPL